MKTLFLNLDRVNQRILVVGFSLSIILLSASCLMLTVSRALASPVETKYNVTIGAGVDDTFVYYFDQRARLRKIAKSEAGDPK
jgi:hypothetical protein